MTLIMCRLPILLSVSNSQAVRPTPPIAKTRTLAQPKYLKLRPRTERPYQALLSSDLQMPPIYRRADFPCGARPRLKSRHPVRIRELLGEFTRLFPVTTTTASRAHRWQHPK